jgi:hypothetical protein
MAFGDSGQWKVSVKGVPFRVDAPSAQEAAAIVRAKISAGEINVRDRAKRLGLSDQDTHVVESRAARAQNQRASGMPVDPDAAVRGQTRVAESLEGVELDLSNLPPVWAAEKLTGREVPTIPLPDGVARTLVGTGRYADSRMTGLEQIGSGAVREHELAAEEKVNKDIYDQFGQGLGLEDIGEAAIPALAFYATGGLSGGALTTAAATGAALNATEAQTDPSAGGRGVKALTGAAEGLVGQAAGNVLLKRLSGAAVPQTNLVKRLGSMFTGSSIGAGGPRYYFKWFNFFKNPQKAPVGQTMATGATADAVEALTRSAREGVATEQGRLQLQLGRAVLDKVEMGIRSLPTSARSGASQAVQDGMFQGILRDSMDVVEGVATLNPGKWQKAMSQTVGRIPSLFKHPGHAQMVTDMNGLVRAMADQKAAGTAYTAESVAQATEALKRAVLGNVDGAVEGAVGQAARGTIAEAEKQAIADSLAALQHASPGSEAQRTLIQSIIDRGRSMMGVAGERTGEEGGDAVEGFGKDLIDHMVPQ